MTPWQISRTFKTGPYMKWVVIPEGLRKEEIADLMQENLGWSEQQKYDWVTKYTNADPNYVEGVYFPDTYLISLEESPQDGVGLNSRLDLGTGASTRVITINSSSVGISEQSPASKLSVSGNGSYGTTYDTIAAPTNGLIVEGNVGIGTTSPFSKLSVQTTSSAGTTPLFTVASSTNASLLTVNSLRASLGLPVNLKAYTVATLPTGTQGDLAYVTDALAPTYLGTIVGGGAVVTPVFFDGTNWVAH
jgi:hypothetical protein